MQFTSQFLEKFKKTSPKEEQSTVSQRRNNWLLIPLFLIVFLLITEISSRLLVNWLWFQEVDSLGVWLTKVTTQVLLAVSVFGFSSFFLSLNFAIAQRLRFPHNLETLSDHSTILKPVLGKITLRPLLIVTGLISLVMSFMLLYYLQMSLSILEGLQIPFLGEISQVSGRVENYEVSNLKSFLPSPFKLQVIQPLVENLWTAKWQFILLLGIFLVLMLQLQLALKIFALLVSSFLTAVVVLNWQKVLLFLNAVPFEQTDPPLSKGYRILYFYVANLGNSCLLVGRTLFLCYLSSWFNLSRVGK